MPMRTGHVFKIVVDKSNEIYIGSTFNVLPCKFRELKDKYYLGIDSDYGKLFDKYGVKNCSMILIATYKIHDKKHLKTKEFLWQVKLKSINRFEVFNLDSMKQNFENNKKIKCVCGKTVAFKHLAKHKKTKFHLAVRNDKI